MTTPEAISARKQRRVHIIESLASPTLGDIETSEPRIRVDQVNDIREEGTARTPQLSTDGISSTQPQSSLQQEDASVVVKPVSRIDEHPQDESPFRLSTRGDVDGDDYSVFSPRTSPNVISGAEGNHKHGPPRPPEAIPYPAFHREVQLPNKSGDTTLLSDVSCPFLVQAILVYLTWD